MKKVVVIGGTGLIGSKVVEQLQRKGHEAIAASPNTGVDTITGEGLVEALAGADVVVDVSNSPSFEDHAAMDFFQTAGRNLIRAEAGAGVRHHVGLSVVGTERFQASGYFRAKLAQERMIAASPIPYTLVRATQFFEFIRAIADFSTRDGTVRLPPVLFQPMAAQDVATAVAEAALAAPVNGIVEVAGPDRVMIDVPVRKVLEKDHDPRRIIVDPEAQYFGIDVTERSLIPDSVPHVGATRFDQWLRTAPPPPAR